MGSLIQFEQSAVATLRERLGAAESANQDLIAFARGHSGAVSSIHAAVLDAIASEDLEALLGTVTRRWPAVLRIDHVALALVVGDQAFRADARGVEFVEPRLVARAIAACGEVELRSVARGHALFGPAAPDVRAEAVIRISAGEGQSLSQPQGLLLIGQSQDEEMDSRHGGSLLLFLGQSLGAIIGRWMSRTSQ